jgi:hypothetical protein
MLEPHRWLEGRRGWERQGGLEWREESYGFAERGTSCLHVLAEIRDINDQVRLTFKNV